MLSDIASQRFRLIVGIPELAFVVAPLIAFVALVRLDQFTLCHVFSSSPRQRVAESNDPQAT
jgi:hypothetical protein